MSRIVLHMMMSLDGFVASVDRSESWMVAPDHGRDAASLEVATTAVAAIAGHDVYHDMAGYWPTAEGDTPTQRAYVERVNQMPKLIITHQPAQLDWNNATALAVPDGDLSRAITELKAPRDGDIVVWGGAALVQQFGEADLFDEYQLFVEPIALGAGEPLFTNTGRWRRLNLISA